MIKMTGLVNLQVLGRELSESEVVGEDRQSRMMLTIKKLKESGRLSKEQSIAVSKIENALQRAAGGINMDVDSDPEGEESDDYLSKEGLLLPETEETDSASAATKSARDAFLAANDRAKNTAAGPARDAAKLAALHDKGNWIAAQKAAVANRADVTEDVTPEEPGNNIANDPTVSNNEDRKAKSDLLALHKQAGELYNMMSDTDQTEDWILSKVQLATDAIASVFNHVQYEKTKPSTVGAGDGYPADNSTETQGQ